MKSLSTVFLFLLLVCLSASGRASDAIMHCMQGDQGYAVDLLMLALSQQDKPYHLERNDWLCSEKRKLKSAAENKIDILWAGANPELNQKLLPVPIPIFKGLTSYRILLIRNGEQQRYSSIESLPDFKKLVFGQGEAWVDTRIFRAAGLRVVTSHSFEILPRMLAYKRFDAFPRGIQQVRNDAKVFSELKLAVEQELAVYYPLPAFYYLSPKNTELAKSLETALEKIIANGKFDDFFYAHPLIADSLDNINLQNRRIFSFENPYLPEGVPLDRKELWLNLERPAVKKP